jgi:CubicO group peptidase (beta-lactamase class C family)
MAAKNGARGALLLLGALLASLRAPAAETDALKDLDAFVEQRLAEWKVPGLSIVVVKDGAVLLARGYGVRDLATREKVTPDTLFSIASATKSFTATVAAMAVEEKKVEWDRPLRTYFPDFRMYDAAAAEKVTLRDLLTHRTGIPRQKFFSLNPPATRREVRDRLRYFEPSADFRSAFQYCNETYTVAGDMLAERLGASWEEIVKARILGPLGMTATLFSVRDMQAAPNHATPYIDWGDGPEAMAFHDAGILGPAGEIVSSANDLSKWLLFNLARGQAGGRRLVDPAQLARIQSPQVTLPRATREKEVLLQSYGMGWFLDAWRGFLHVHHGGVLYGFSSHVSFLPTENVGLVVLANLNGTPLPTILEGYVYDRLLGLPPTDWTGRARALEDRAKEAWEKARTEEAKDPCGKPKTKAGRPLEAYAGTYRSDGYGTIVVRRAAAGLEATLWTDACPLKACGGDGFDLYHPVERQAWKVTFQGPPGEAPASFSVAPAPGLRDVVYRRE